MTQNSRTALSLWERLVGATNTGSEEQELTEEQVEACIHQYETEQQHAEHPPVASKEARRQLMEFMNDMRHKSRVMDAASENSATWRSPFDNHRHDYTAPTTTTQATQPPQSSPPLEPITIDLRVPVVLGRPEMVHVAQ